MLPTKADIPDYGYSAFPLPIFCAQFLFESNCTPVWERNLLIVCSFQLNGRIIPKLFDDPIKGSCSGDNSFSGEVLAVVLVAH